MLKKIFIDKMVESFRENENYIRESINLYCHSKRTVKIIDVGCGDGAMTNKFIRDIDIAHETYGIDGCDSCENSKIKYRKANLDGESFPFADNEFDVVISNQVIEHILNKDFFISECYRILKSGGLCVISTENVASFDNILSLILGQEPLSQHTGSKFITNSFLSPHFMERVDAKFGNKYLHKNVCSYYGLKRLARVNGFENIKIKSFGNFFWVLEKLFPIYNRLILVYGLKE